MIIKSSISFKNLDLFENVLKLKYILLKNSYKAYQHNVFRQNIFCSLVESMMLRHVVKYIKVYISYQYSDKRMDSIGTI